MRATTSRVILNMDTPASAPVWSRLSEGFLIENIRQHRCLWDHRYAEYAKKGLKMKAYNDITLLLRKHLEDLANVTACKFVLSVPFVIIKLSLGTHYLLKLQYIC